jgi:hypothetical protein
MFKRLLLASYKGVLADHQPVSLKKSCLVYFGVSLFLSLSTTIAFAEGSKEISVSGGYRAFLYSSTTGSNSFPFPTLGTMKVYVNVGETINIGSSAQGMGAGTINLRSPDGKTYTSGNNTSIGLRQPQPGTCRAASKCRRLHPLYHHRKSGTSRCLGSRFYFGKRQHGFWAAVARPCQR